MSKNTKIADLINYISVDGSGNVVLTTGGQVATQSYVTTAVANLVNSAPTALDTLKELATALNNDANFATTVTNSIATKLPLSGGTLTGALNGTTATFSSSVQSAGLVSSKAANDTVRETNAAAWIGDLSAQDGLMIQNLASAPYGTALQVGGYGSNYAANYPMILQPRGGNVGIGTTSFSYSATGRGLLEVNGTSGQSALIGLKQGDVASGYLYGDNGNMILWAEGSRNLQIGIASAGNMLFSTNNTERMRITSGGDIEFKGGAVRANGGYFRVADSAGTTTSGYLIRESVWLGSGTSSNLALAAENPTGSIAFFTGGTAIEKMRISSAGVVTRPYQPFVMGGLNGNQSIPSTTFTTLNFDTTVGGFFYANVGSSWNNSTRTFTAPVTGIYMVTVSLMTDSVGQLAMFVNGTRKHSIPTPPFSGSITWGGTCMIPLNAGESLTLQGYGNAGTVTQNQYHTWFAIYLL